MLIREAARPAARPVASTVTLLPNASLIKTGIFFREISLADSLAASSNVEVFVPRASDRP